VLQPLRESIQTKLQGSGQSASALAGATLCQQKPLLEQLWRIYPQSRATNLLLGDERVTKPDSKRNVDILEFEANAERLKPVPLGARSEPSRRRQRANTAAPRCAPMGAACARVRN